MRVPALLPEIAECKEAIGEALADVLRPTPLLELGSFLIARPIKSHVAGVHDRSGADLVSVLTAVRRVGGRRFG